MRAPVIAALFVSLVACGGSVEPATDHPTDRATDAEADAADQAGEPAACAAVTRAACADGHAFSCPVVDGGLAAKPPADAGPCRALFDGTTVPVTAETFCCDGAGH